MVTLEDGTIRGYNIRAAKSDPSFESKPSFTLHAYDMTACTLSYNPAAPNLLATGSVDKMVKFWDLSNINLHVLHPEIPRQELSFQFPSHKIILFCWLLEAQSENWEFGVHYLRQASHKNLGTTAIRIDPKHNVEVLGLGWFSSIPNIPEFPPGKGPETFHGEVRHSMDYAAMDYELAAKCIKGKRIVIVELQKSAKWL
ncbi:hypothetical protein QUC31_020346 [Theobroma cacao]